MTTSPDKILSGLGARITTARKNIMIQIFNSHSPISAEDITSKQKVNKTTVYRELDFLLGKGVITEVDLSDGKKRYEPAYLDHHHHLTCISCKSINDVKLNESLASEEKKIFEQNNFKVIKHNLEFFGYCINCQ